jgi:hypothetical protein
MLNFAEDLGRILGTTQAKASAWLNQRQHIAKQLGQVRDTAERLLSELTGSTGKVSAPRQRARKATTAKRPRRRRMSAEARRKISEAAKKRWAAVRARKAKGGS